MPVTHATQIDIFDREKLMVCWASDSGEWVAGIGPIETADLRLHAVGASPIEALGRLLGNPAGGRREAGDIHVAAVGLMMTTDEYLMLFRLGGSGSWWAGICQVYHDDERFTHRAETPIAALAGLLLQAGARIEGAN